MSLQNTPTDFQYFMENPNESSRLHIKTDQSSTRHQLVQTGITELRDCPHIVDAGSGSGAVANEIAKVVSSHYDQARITLLDGSSERLESAKQYLGEHRNITPQFQKCQLENIPLETDSVDYLFCRFVFEYLKDQQAVFTELCRVVRPGGKIVVGDLDYNGISHYPLSSSLEKQVQELTEVIQGSGNFDVYAGRRIYSYFHQAGLSNIDIHLSAHHLFWGELSKADEVNWTAKLDQLIQLQDAGSVDVSFDLRLFKTAFLDFLQSPERFSYTPLILVEGEIPM